MQHLLAINTGSSSLKAALFEAGIPPRRMLTASVERIGSGSGHLRVADVRGSAVFERDGDMPDHEAAVHVFLSWLAQSGLDAGLLAAGHRVVHGGSRYAEPSLVTPELIGALRALVPIDSDHLPQALAAIDAVARLHPGLPQVACFDTAFHHAMPAVARRYPLSERLHDEGVVRYGFHGLSYEYIVQALRAEGGGAADGRMVIAHLGSGASMAAVRDGSCLDTTMGFTPTGGLMMATRTGDIDPGVLLYLMQQRGMDAAALSELVNKRAGLLGVSGSSADVRELLARESTDARAAAALELFCYIVRKFLGALSAVLGGLDTLVFTAGIGEHAAPVRARVCTGFDYLGIELDPERNAANAPTISRTSSRVTVRVLPTDEELMVAQHTYKVVSPR